MERKIVCAANQNIEFSSLILVGIRHWDKIMCDQLEKVIAIEQSQNSPDCKDFIKKKYKTSNFIQGFLDNSGNFLTREEAYKVAKAANQIIEKTGGEGNVILYSEDLY